MKYMDRVDPGKKSQKWRDDNSQWTRVIHHESPSEHWVTVCVNTLLWYLSAFIRQTLPLFGALSNASGGSSWPNILAASNAS
ncbi:MAG: hypothetical protein KJP06_09035 [Deltaproteobacteria bacterium]|nr:hypothetical protein [Deltaproteobacteria bacterium]